MMIFNRDLILELIDECEIGESIEGMELIQAGDWINSGKYDDCYWIFKYNDKFYMVTDSRTGSYYSDYYYTSEDWFNMIECPEVKPVLVHTTNWEYVK